MKWIYTHIFLKISHQIICCVCRAYRAFYILNWIYRYFTETHFSRWICKLIKIKIKNTFQHCCFKYIYSDFSIYFCFISQPVYLVSSKQLSMQISFTTTLLGVNHNASTTLSLSYTRYVDNMTFFFSFSFSPQLEK